MKGKLAFILSGVGLAAFGLFMLLNPAAVVNLAAFVFSIGLVAKGFWSLRGMVKLDRTARKIELPEGMDTMKKAMLTNSLVAFGIGVLALLVSVVSLINGSGGIMKASVYIIALGFLLTGIIGMVENQRFRSYGEVGDAFRDKAFVYVLVAVLLFVFPFLIGSIVIFILGGAIVLVGVGLIVFGCKAKVIETSSSATASEVEFREIPGDGDN